MLKLLVLLFSFFSTDAYATKKTHFTIAIDPEYIPFTQKDIYGKPTGILVDFWNLWAKTNHYSVSYLFYEWEETLNTTERGEVDFHSGTTKDRDWMHASDTIYELRTELFVKRDSKLSTPVDFVGKRIGTIDAYYGEQVKEIIGDTVQIIVYNDYAPLVEALKNNKIDALIDDVEAIRYYLIKTGEMNKYKSLENEQLSFVNKIYAITNNKNSALIAQINEGIKKLDLLDLVKIEKVWLPRIEKAFYNKKLIHQIVYSDDEKKWLKLQDNLSITGDPLWFRDDSNHLHEYRGVAGDYLSSLSSKLKVNLAFLPIDSWAELLATPEKERPDIIMGTMNKALRNLFSEHYRFLTPQSIGPLVMIMDKNIRFITDLQDINDKRVGVLSLQEYTEQLEYKFEAYTFNHYATINTLLEKVLNKEIKVAILPLPDAILLLANDKYKALDIVGKLDHQAYMHIGVLKDKVYLQGILAKALIHISLFYKNTILSKWTHKLNYIEKIDYTYTYRVIMAFMVVLLFLGLYIVGLQKNRALEHQAKLKIEAMTVLDDLTGLKNRRAFNHDFEKPYQNLQTISLLFIDIDNFKYYNDTYGHLNGDKALTVVGNVLRTFESKHASVYRIGGEEYGFILYNYTQDESVILAQKICDAVAELKVTRDDILEKITVSIGVGIDVVSNNRKVLYHRADKALYIAKQRGRNQVYPDAMG